MCLSVHSWPSVFWKRRKLLLHIIRLLNLLALNVHSCCHSISYFLKGLIHYSELEKVSDKLSIRVTQSWTNNTLIYFKKKCYNSTWSHVKCLTKPSWHYEIRLLKYLKFPLFLGHMGSSIGTVSYTHLTLPTTPYV